MLDFANTNGYGEPIRADGWREFTPDEKFIFYELNPKALFRLADYAFRYSMAEAEILDVDRQTMAYKDLHDGNRRRVVGNAASAIRQGHDLIWECYDDKSIQTTLRNKYVDTDDLTKKLK